MKQNTMAKTQQAIYTQIKNVPGKVTQVDPKIYRNGKQKGVTRYGYERYSVYGLTQFFDREQERKVDVPFAIEVDVPEYETEIRVRTRAMYYWNANHYRDPEYWKEVVDLDDIDHDGKVSAHAVAMFLHRAGCETEHGNGSIQATSGHELEDFLININAVPDIVIKANDFSCLDPDQLDQSIKVNNQIEYQTDYDPKAKPVEKLLRLTDSFADKYREKYQLNLVSLDKTKIASDLDNTGKYDAILGNSDWQKRKNGLCVKEQYGVRVQIDANNDLTLTVVKIGIDQQGNKLTQAVANKLNANLGGSLEQLVRGLWAELRN